MRQLKKTATPKLVIEQDIAPADNPLVLIQDPEPLDKAEIIRALNSQRLTKKDLQTLSRAVGDPSTAESVWVAACIAAGDKPLTNQEPFITRLCSKMMTAMGVLFAIFTVPVTFSTAALFAGSICWKLCGLDLNWFMNASGAGLGTGQTLGFLAAMPFWIAMTIKTKKAARMAATCSTLFLTALAFGSCSHTQLGACFGVLLVCTLAFSAFGLTKLGTLCRESLPKTFNGTKLARSLVGVLSPAALLMGCAFWQVFHGWHRSPYTPPTDIGVYLFLIILAYWVSIPGFVLARSCKSRSPAASALLSVVVQAPVLLGMFVTTVLAAMSTVMAGLGGGGIEMMHSIFPTNTFDTLLAHFGGTKALTLALTTLLSTLLAAAGGWLGAATINRKRKQQIRAGSSQE